MKLTDEQYKACEYIGLEAERWQRLGMRMKDIGMHLMATTCKHVSKELSDTMELQLRLLKRDGTTLIPENWRPE